MFRRDTAIPRPPSRALRRWAREREEAGWLRTREPFREKVVSLP